MFVSIGGVSVTMAMVGVGLFAAAAVLALVAVARRDDMTGLLIGSLTMAVAFFGLPTRVHERYLFPALALAAPLVGTAVRWAAAYVALSALFFLNIYWVYSFDWSYAGEPYLAPGLNGDPFLRDPLLAATVFSQWGVYLGLVHLGARPRLDRVAGVQARRPVTCARTSPTPRPSRRPRRRAPSVLPGAGQAGAGCARTRSARPSVTRRAGSTAWTSPWWWGSCCWPSSSACGAWTSRAR